MFKYVLALALLGFAAASPAATLYIRPDGGTITQCTGTANAAYPGTGTNQLCAWSGPMVAFGSGPESGSGATVNNVKGGDTVYVEPGQYPVGFGAPGATSAGCEKPNWSYDCVMNPIPAGTAAAPTNLIGVLDSNGKPPQFYGVNRASEVLNMTNSSFTNVTNLEVTTHAQCIYNHPTNPCPRSLPFPAGTANTQYADNGVFIYNATGVNLKNLNIHNLANSGIQAGSLNNFSMNNVVLRANGWSGFDGDVSGRGLKSSNSGNITFANVLISYSGCGEQWPTNTIYGCFGQAGGGYGDGLGATGTGGNWVIIDSKAMYNTQDGFDLLYADGTGSVSFIRSMAVGNAGNQFKAGGGTVLISNSVGIGNCASFLGLYNMTGTNSGNNNGSTAGDMCRAEGNTVSIAMQPGKTATIQDSTFTTQGTCQIVTAGNSDGGSINAANNIFVGGKQYLSLSRQTCTFYDSGKDNGHTAVTAKFYNNIEFNDSPVQVGSIVADPLLKNESLSGFDGTLLQGSPAIGKALSTFMTAYDINSAARGAGPFDIGAYRYGGAVVNPPPQTKWCWQSPTPTSAPVAVTCP
jgi:hypothetical protein